MIFTGATAGTGGGGPAQIGTVTVDATLDGKPLRGEVLLLDTTGSVRVSVTVHNGTATIRHVKTVRLSGTALALTFFAYDTTVPFEVPSRQSVTRAFVLDLADLGSQVTGLLPTEVEVVDVNRDVIAVVGATGDVRGSLWSVYGVFGLAVLGLTALSWAGALFALARGRLPANRWQRAMRFLPAGIGTGLAAVISLSVLRLMAPSPAAEIPFVLGAAAVALVLGYLTPHPGEADDDPAPPRLSPIAGSSGGGPDGDRTERITRRRPPEGAA